MTGQVRCAIAGCGMVADEYARTLTASSLTELIGCTDFDPQRAHRFAERHAITAVSSLDELLGEHAVELLIVLTPPAAHEQVATAALTAGISVYVEKPLTLDIASAQRLVTLADSNDVVLGAAPDTFLAPPAQTAAAAIQAGHIGEPVSAAASCLSPGPERWHPAPQPFHGPGIGPLFDMAPYYLTTLVHLLGPIATVQGALAATRAERTIASDPAVGQTFTAYAPTHVEALLRTETRLPVTLTTSFDIQATTRPHLEIYGTEGTLVLPDPNFHHGPVQLRLRGDGDWRTLPQEPPTLDVAGRGMGAIEAARSLTTGRTMLATATTALHILKVMSAVRASAALTALQPIADAL